MSPSPLDTNAPPPPAFAVTAPTPRTFNFPRTHNLSDSPSPSPCATPEPELASSPSRPQLDLIVNLSPTSSLGSPSSISSPRLTKRRKSSDSEHRPRKGDEGYVKRPENAFMLFRRKYCEDRLLASDNGDGSSKKPRQADLSKAISLEWKSLSTAQRQHWQQRAEEKKRQHEEMYPGYVYRPQRARDADGKVVKNKKRVKRGERGEHDHETDNKNLTAILPNQQAARFQRRSLSAPTPPLPYHTIQFPNVYITPSCPTSPSLPPLIKRRSSYPGHPEDIMLNFDYPPNEADSGMFPPESSEFQTVFNMTSLYNDVDPSCSLLPPHEINTSESSQFSGGAGSSGPPSPLTGPLTPVISSGFSQLDTTDYSSPIQQNCGSQIFDDQFDFIPQGVDPSCQNQQFDFPAYVWGSNNALAMWSNSTSGVMMSQDDFDISSIPSVQLGIAQFDGSIPTSEPHHYVEYPPTQYHDEGYLRYDEMINGF